MLIPTMGTKANYYLSLTEAPKTFTICNQTFL